MPLHNHHMESSASATASVPQTEADVRMVALVARTVFDLLGERSAPGHKIKPVTSTKVKEPANRTRRPRRVILAVSLQRRGERMLLIFY
jgi:hypothetical protein